MKYGRGMPRPYNNKNNKKNNTKNKKNNKKEEEQQPVRQELLHKPAQLGLLRHTAQPSQIIIMFTLGEKLGTKAVGTGDTFEGREVQVKPGKGGSLHIAVLHGIGQFAVISIGFVPLERAVLVFVEITQVGRIKQDLTCGGEKLIEMLEEGGQGGDAPHNADTIHQHQNRVVAFGHLPKVLHPCLSHATFAHGLHTEFRKVDGMDFDSACLKYQRVTTSAGSYIQHFACSERKCLLFKGWHFLPGAKQCRYGNFVFVKIGGKHTEAGCTPLLPIICDGGTHRVGMMKGHE